MLVRFGRWDEILAEPAPPADLPCAVGTWHYAREGMGITPVPVPTENSVRVAYIDVIASACASKSHADRLSRNASRRFGFGPRGGPGVTSSSWSVSGGCSARNGSVL